MRGSRKQPHQLQQPQRIMVLELEPSYSSYDYDETEKFVVHSPHQGKSTAGKPAVSRNYMSFVRSILLAGLVIILCIAWGYTKEGLPDEPMDDTLALLLGATDSVDSTTTTINSSSSIITTIHEDLTRNEHEQEEPISLPTVTDELAQFGTGEYLEKADNLIERAMNAILAEYGQEPINFSDYNTSKIPPMFAWTRVDLESATEPPEEFGNRGKNRGNGGWTSPRSWNGLVSRLIQALVTRKDFTVVLGGHSAAAGHGNHFRQSYLMKFHQVMEPVFRQLQVNLISRNQAQGGLGTVHSSLGFSSIYGSDIDLMLWDSGMTEKNKPEHIDLFFRQALMVEGRVPVVWSAGGKFDLLQMLHNVADADVGEFGLGLYGIPETNEENLDTLPWAVQRFECEEDYKSLCKGHKFCATCWIDPRPDKIHPKQKQYDSPHGQVKWHPGWRSHQLAGRVIAFTLLQAMKDAVDLIRRDMSSDFVQETIQGMDAHYHNIREKVKQLDPSLGHCYRINTTLPERICRTSMKGRTQYTPRNSPRTTSITSILKPAPDGYVPQNTRTALYEGEDVPNACLQLPPGAVDVVASILGNHDPDRQRRLLEEENSTSHSDTIPMEREQAGYDALDETTDSIEWTSTEDSSVPDIVIPGRGWEVFDEPQGYCDGTYESVCARSTKNRCVLYGHHDERGSVLGSELSGWLVLQIPRAEIQAGLVLLKLHTWYEPKDNSRTIRWHTINNVNISHHSSEAPASEEDSPDDDATRQRRHLTTNVPDNEDNTERDLRQKDYETPELPEAFQFEYAIDGVITTLDKASFLERKKYIQRMVEVLTLLDDESFASTSVSENDFLEVAIRMRGCGHYCVFGVTHLYWA